MTGIIAKLTDRGYGFIGQGEEDEEDDIFFHASELEGVEFEDLSEGDEVEFEVEDTDKGKSAINVTLA
ncbi:MAG: cold-shock protein [Candidatus Magasanikbacteria bacterium]